MQPRRVTDETRKRLDAVEKAYAKHVASILPSLPLGAQLLARLSFHDARISALTFPSPDRLVVTLEHAWLSPLGGREEGIPPGLLGSASQTLSFIGVESHRIPEKIVGKTWLYEEIHLAATAVFEYRVLLADDGMRVDADDVAIDWSGGSEP